MINSMSLLCSEIEKKGEDAHFQRPTPVFISYPLSIKIGPHIGPHREATFFVKMSNNLLYKYRKIFKKLIWE